MFSRGGGSGNREVRMDARRSNQQNRDGNQLAVIEGWNNEWKPLSESSPSDWVDGTGCFRARFVAFVLLLVR